MNGSLSPEAKRLSVCDATGEELAEPEQGRMWSKPADLDFVTSGEIVVIRVSGVPLSDSSTSTEDLGDDGLSFTKAHGMTVTRCLINRFCPS